MARRLRDSALDTREARRKLKPRGKPYWRSVGKGLHLGYRKGKKAAEDKANGVWVIRRYLGGQAYEVQTIAQADDLDDANGIEVLDFWQAQEVTRNMRQRARKLGPYTVRDAINDYLEHLGERPSAKDTRKRLEAFAIPAFGDKSVMDLEPDEIRKWHRGIAKMPARVRTRKGAEQAYRVGDPDDPETVRKRQASANRCLSLLKAALNLAWQEKPKLVPSNDAWRRVQMFKGVDIPRTRYLTMAECQRLINASEGDFRVLVRAALETGARYQELARLRVSDFNSDAGTLHIRKSKTSKDRHVILTNEGSEFFSQFAVGRPSMALLLGREWKPSHQDPLIREACKRAGIVPHVSFHVLRHTWASHCVMAGIPLMVVAKNMGHTDTRMVEVHYGHLSEDFVTEAIRSRAPRFGEAEPSNVKAMA